MPRSFYPSEGGRGDERGWDGADGRQGQFIGAKAGRRVGGID